jgi:hypothetical protein
MLGMKLSKEIIILTDIYLSLGLSNFAGQKDRDPRMTDSILQWRLNNLEMSD